MTTGMDCRRCQEMLSDARAGVLGEPLASDLRRHLQECRQCRELDAALADVLEALASFPVLAAPEGLAERAATRALAAPHPAPRRAAGARLQAAAATLLIAVGAGLLSSAGTANPARAARGLKERTVHVGAYITEHKERLLEDLHMLRVVLGTAFEGRLDRVNDRVDDYRRLLERRRPAPDPKKSTSFYREVNQGHQRLVDLTGKDEAGSVRSRTT